MKNFIHKVKISFTWYAGLLDQKIRYLWLDFTCEHSYIKVYECNEKNIKPHRAFQCVKCGKWRIES